MKSGRPLRRKWLTALRWQKEQARIALERWERGDGEELTIEALRAAHQAALNCRR